MSRRESSKRVDVCIGIRDSKLWVQGSTTRSTACGDASNVDASGDPSSLHPQHRRQHYRAPASKSSNPSSSNILSEHTHHPAIPRLLARSPPITLPSAQTPPTWKQQPPTIRVPLYRSTLPPYPSKAITGFINLSTKPTLS